MGVIMIEMFKKKFTGPHKKKSPYNVNSIVIYTK